MKAYRGIALFAIVSASWAQSAATGKTPAPKAPVVKRAAGAAKKPAAKPPEPTLDPATLKLLRAVAAKYQKLQNYELSMSIDSGRQVDEEARQALCKAEVKMIVAAPGKYSLDVIEGDDEKPSYKVIADGATHWVDVPELKQYKESRQAPSKPVSAAEPSAQGPLEADESLVERLSRQVVPLLAGLDKSIARGFVRGRLLTLMSKPDKEGHGDLLYITLANEDGEVSQLSWYVSSGPENHRMLMRTDFVITGFKTLTDVPAGEFSYSPRSGATAYVAAAAPPAVQ